MPLCVVPQVDESLFEAICDVFRQIFPLMACFFVLTGANLYFVLCVPPIGYIYYLIQIEYVRTSRSVKRLDSTTRSPIFQHFAETLNGSEKAHNSPGLIRSGPLCHFQPITTVRRAF